MLGNSQEKVQQQKQAIFEDRAVEQKDHPKLEPQTIAAVAWYNYYKSQVPGFGISGQDITDFDQRLKKDVNIEKTVLFQTLEDQQAKMASIKQGLMGEPFS